MRRFDKNSYKTGEIVDELLHGAGAVVFPGLFDKDTVDLAWQDWQGSARARLGLAFDRWMVYGTGGVSFTEYERRIFAPGAGFGERLTSARTGWNVGAGVNFAFTDHLILGAEYRYTDFGRNRFASSGAFPGLTGSQELSSHSARASVAYKF